MMSKKFVKVMCIILAILMLLSGVAVLTQVFAASPVPATGVEDDPALLIIGIVLCLLIIILCIALPRLRKKKSNIDTDDGVLETKGENNQ